MNAGSFLAAAWHSPAAFAEASEETWRRILPAARHARLLARLGTRLRAAGLWDEIPSAARGQLLSAMTTADAARRHLAWEAGEVRDALLDADIPFMLIKGAAYTAAELAMARGRMSSDLDVLVAPDRLTAAERALAAAGYGAVPSDPEEERHMRAWLHQAPALRHRLRGTAVDLHHAIAPPRGRLATDSHRLLARAGPSAWPGCPVPDPCDMTLICAVHLARETEIAIALRDVVDFDELMHAFPDVLDFDALLLARARELGLVPALGFAARTASRLLRMPSPAGFGPRSGPLGLLIDLGLPPDGAEPPGVATRGARALLRLRALRMQMPVRRMAARSARDKLRRMSARARGSRTRSAG